MDEKARTPYYFVIHFRYVPPEMMMAPGYCIAKERMGIWAESPEDARRKFYADVGGHSTPDDYRIDEIELGTTKEGA